MKARNLVLERSIELEIPANVSPEQIIQAVTNARNRSQQDFVQDSTVLDFESVLEYWAAGNIKVYCRDNLRYNITNDELPNESVVIDSTVEALSLDSTSSEPGK